MNYEKIGEALLTENLSEILARAEAGNVLAAREALEMCAFLVSPMNKHPTTSEPLPVPVFVREYLSKSLYRMAQGEDANRSMNLKKSGPKKWTHFDKRLAASLVFQLFEQGVPILEAGGAAAEAINEHISAYPCPIAWRSFQGETISGDILQTWYYELIDELTAINSADL